MPKVRRYSLPPALFQHLLDRVQSQRISAAALAELTAWLDGEPDVPDGEWYRKFNGMTACGEGPSIKTFLLPGQAPKGKKIR